MVTWNLQYDDELPVIDYCREHHKGVLIKKALASGHATLAGEDPIQKTFDMLFAHQGVSSAIVGTINAEHLATNVRKAVQASRGI